VTQEQGARRVILASRVTLEQPVLLAIRALKAIQVLQVLKEIQAPRVTPGLNRITLTQRREMATLEAGNCGSIMALLLMLRKSILMMKTQTQ
jgi:hypothetical protein